MSAKAAFYDVDGTLVRTNIVHTYAYYAMNRGSLTGIAARTLATVAQIPVYAGLDLINRKVFNEYFYRAYEGCRGSAGGARGGAAGGGAEAGDLP
jgi:phosphoserine phosphatase